MNNAYSQSVGKRTAMERDQLLEYEGLVLAKADLQNRFQSLPDQQSPTNEYDKYKASNKTRKTNDLPNGISPRNKRDAAMFLSRETNDQYES